MKCDICHQDIKPWQDRHSSGNINCHLSCEIGETPLKEPIDSTAKSYKLNWFSGRISFDPRRSRDE